MDRFLSQAFAPFFLLLLLLVARPIGKLIQKFIPDGAVKRYLTKPRSDRSKFFERADAKMFAYFRRLFSKAR